MLTSVSVQSYTPNSSPLHQCAIKASVQQSIRAIKLDPSRFKSPRYPNKCIPSIRSKSWSSIRKSRDDSVRRAAVAYKCTYVSVDGVPTGDSGVDGTVNVPGHVRRVPLYKLVSWRVVASVVPRGLLAACVRVCVCVCTSPVCGASLADVCAQPTEMTTSPLQVP